MFASHGRKMLFHLVGLKVGECQEIHNLIVNNGGRVVNYQEYDVMVLANRYHSEICRVFHINFVRDCVSRGCILDMIPYMLGPEKHMCLVSAYLYGKSSCYVSCKDASIQTCHTLTDDDLSGTDCVSRSKLTIGSDYEVPGIECQSQEFSSTFHDHALDSISPNFMSSTLEIKLSASQLERNSTSSPVQTETCFESNSESLSEQTNREANSPVSDAETIVIRKSQKRKKTVQKQYSDSDESHSPPEKNGAFFDIPSPIGRRTRSNITKNFTSNDLSNEVAIIDDSEEPDEQASVSNPQKRFSTEEKSSSSNFKTKRNDLRNAAKRQKLEPVKDESAIIDSDEEMKVCSSAENQCPELVTMSSWISRANSTQQNIDLFPRVEVTEINDTALPRQLKRKINNDESESFPLKTKSRVSELVNTVFPSRPITSLTRRECTDVEDLSDSSTDTEKPTTSKSSGVSKKSQEFAVVETKAAKTNKIVKKNNNSAKKIDLLNSSSDETDFEIDQEQSDAAEKEETAVVKSEDVSQTEENDDSGKQRTISRNIATWEQKKMIKFLIDTRQIHLAKGNAVWAQMISQGVQICIKCLCVISEYLKDEQWKSYIIFVSD